MPKIRRREYDVVIIGSGPAGAACATLLARAGVDVALVTGRSRPRPRPAEVCAPPTLRLIRHLDLPVPGTWGDARVCRGVLSVWGEQEPEFSDYELHAYGAATTIDRADYDSALIRAAHSAGATLILGGRSAVVGRHSDRWSIPDADLQAVLMVDASGRGGGIVPGLTAPRIFHDRLIALTTQLSRYEDADSDLLLLEGVEGGWWYVSQAAGSSASVVYLSDADLIPRDHQKRVEHLERAFGATLLMRERLHPVPRFKTHRMSDARSSSRVPVAGFDWLAIGDAALSADPLSGEGLRFALAGAERAADAIRSGWLDGDPTPMHQFSSWYQEQGQLLRRQATVAYEPIAKRFHADPFWQRRARSLEEMTSSPQ